MIHPPSRTFLQQLREIEHRARLSRGSETGFYAHTLYNGFGDREPTRELDIDLSKLESEGPDQRGFIIGSVRL